MSVSSNLAQSSAKSGFNVLWGLIFSSIIGAVGTIIDGLPLFLGTYIVRVPLAGAINYTDTQNLKDAVKSLGPLAVFINLFLYPNRKNC